MMKTGRVRQAREDAHRWRSHPSVPLQHPGRGLHMKTMGLDLLLVMVVKLVMVVVVVTGGDVDRDR